MDILVVSNMYPSAKMPSYGTFVKNFVDDISRRNGGGVVDVCTIEGRRAGMAAKMKAYAGYYMRLLKALVTSRHDLVYVHAITFPAPVLRAVCAFRRLPLVLNVHGDDVLPSNRLKRCLKRLAAPLVGKARLVVCPSRYFAGVLAAEFPSLDPSRVFVSPSGGLVPQFYMDKRTVTPPGAPLTLGYVSRIDPGKGWEMFVDAVDRLNREGVPCRGIMAGRGSGEGELREMIARRGLSGTIEFLGPQPQHSLPQLYHSFDLFLFPTMLRSESLGLVGLEAMAAGTPVIAARMSGPQGYVDDGVNGYLFTPGDTADMCRAVREYAALGTDVRMAMSRAARITAGDYEADRVGRDLYTRLTSLV